MEETGPVQAAARARVSDAAPVPAPVVASDRPRPHEEVSAYPLDDELVVYDGRSAQVHVLNATAATLWPLLDGATSVAALAEALAERFALNDARALADTVELVERLRDADLLAAD
jgi:PqqD family protein of HPr-rel-A system